MLAVDRIGPPILADLGHVFELDLATAGEVDCQPLERFEVFAVVFVEPHHQVKGPLPVEHLRQYLPLHGGFDVFVDVDSAQAVGIQLAAVDLDLQLRYHDLLFDLQIAHPVDTLDGRFQFLGFVAQHVQVVAKQLDGDLGFHAGDHVRDQMRQRLLDRRDDAGNVLQRVADLVDDLLARAGRVGIHRGDELADVDSLGVLVQFGPAGLADEGRQIGDLLQPLFDHLGDFVALGQRAARRQQHVDLHGPFVERRQEVALQPRHRQAGHDHRGAGGQQDRRGDSQAGSDRPAGEPLEQPQYRAVLFVATQLGVLE